MDFQLNEEQQAIADLTDQILGDLCTHDRLKSLSASKDFVDREAWAALAEAGVTGAAIPTEHGGLGLGFLATAVALQSAGRHASPVPLLTTVVMGAMPLVEFGTSDQHAAWLPGIADGSQLVAAAMYEPGTAAASPLLQAEPDQDGFRLRGVKPMVDGGLDADLLLVPARFENGRTGVFLVPSDTEGIARQVVDVTNGRSQAHVTFDGVPVTADQLLGGPEADGSAIVAWIEQRATVAMCMMMAGAAEASIALAAEYTKQREQFGRAVATFQAVSNRAGDSYIDTEAIILTAWQAAWRIDAGLAAEEQTRIAAWWAAEGGYRVVHAAVHVHGGVGVDRDYPLHRHFLLARQLELTLGNGEDHLEALGRALAES
jgi:alkylation response protein AidB-like acyl-CoA dehydrogenase